MAKNKPSSTPEDYEAFYDKEFINNLAFINNVATSRSQFLKNLLDTNGNRDINQECNYPETNSLTISDYREMYDREPIATRVVNIYPDECWKVSPDVFETNDEEVETDFEIAWKEISTKLAVGKDSKFKTDVGNPIWNYLRRADRLSGIGFYGVILLGLSDGKKLREPAEFKKGQELLFIRCFDEKSIDITSYETDPTNPRFGKPLIYSIEFSNPQDVTTQTGGVSSTTKDVHWSRIVHLADNTGSNEIFGVPRQRPVWNRLLDLRKIYGSSGEGFWKGHFPGISVESHPSLGANVKIDVDQVKGQMQDYMNGLQRYLALAGLSAKSLAPQVADPGPHIDAQIDAICVQLACPKRIFMGSERGELASSQDKDTWNERLEARQNNYLTPKVIVPFVDSLINLGVLPEPEEYFVTWPDLSTQSEETTATTAAKKTEAMAKYVQGDVEAIMTPVDFFVNVLGMSGELANAILDNVEEVGEGEKFTESLEPEPMLVGGNGPPIPKKLNKDESLLGV